MSILRETNNMLHQKPRLGSPFTTAIIVAGGSGSRMNRQIPKQFLPVFGKPVIVHTLLAFENSKDIHAIVVVVNKDYISKINEYVNTFSISKVVKIVEGGSTRQESVEKGYQAIPNQTEYIAIHDAARCLITPKQIHSVCIAAFAYEAASAGTPCTDTIKKVNRDCFVEEHLNRNELWNISTPQVFSVNYYALAVKYAKDKNATVTDDTGYMEYINQRVKLVDIGSENLKITYPLDLIVAETILSNRAKENER